MSFPVPSRRAASVLATLSATLGVLATTAASTALAASSITSIRVTNGDLVVDKTATIAVAGFGDPAETGRYLHVDVNSPSLPCAATAGLNEERRIAYTGNDSAPQGAFDEVRSFTPKASGAIILCAYLRDWAPDTTLASAATPAMVRQPNTSLTLALPSDRLPDGVDTPLQITAYAEVRRDYTVEANAIGVPCAPSADANQEVRQWIWKNEIIGGPSTVIENVTTPAPGHYHLCGYVGTYPTDPSPTTVSLGPSFWTGPPPKCRPGAAPSRPGGSVRITCVSVDGSITVTSTRGHKRFETTVDLVGGVGAVDGRAIGLKRNARVSVSIYQGAAAIGARVLRVKTRRR